MDKKETADKNGEEKVLPDEKKLSPEKQDKLDKTNQQKDFWNRHLLTWENNFLTPNSVHAKQHIKCINIAKKLPKGSNVIEVGCGTGLFVEDLLEERDYQYLAFDFSTTAIEGTQARATSASFRKVPIESIKKYLNTYPFDYQAIISIELLNWISSDELKTIAKLSSGKKYIHTFLSHPTLLQKGIHFVKNLIVYNKDYKLAKENFYTDEQILKYFPDAKIISDPELEFHRIVTNI